MLSPKQKDILNSIAEMDVKPRLEGDTSGHDWWHIYRVISLAQKIASREGADLYIVILAALLHDIADWKNHGGDTTIGPRTAEQIMEKYDIPPITIDHVCQIIAKMSFKGAGVASIMDTIEGEVVQDADRLDAMGAIGIARAFAYGGSRKRVMHDPKIAPRLHTSSQEYISSIGTTLNHFYEKLLLLKDLMNTETGRQLAQERHRVMDEFVTRFLQEWEGDA